jgi:dTDP-glucose pyrophosphorylase/predicted transcriptional regulator
MDRASKIWHDYLISPDSEIEEVIHNLNSTGLRLSLVVTPEKKLIGTVSDGDIRRGLISGLNLRNSIDEIINRNPITCPPDTGLPQILEIMSENKVQQIPILNEEGYVIGLHNWYDIKSEFSHDNAIIIMAGGKGTRLFPVTENCPKSMLLVDGKPILRHIIENARMAGFKNIVIAVHHLSEIIENYFGDGESLGVKIEYLKERSPLGTAGALSLLNPKPTKPIIVTNGDLITSIDFAKLLDFHLSLDASATMAVTEYKTQNPYGVVELEGLNIVNYREKPTTKVYVNAGVYVLDAKLLDLIGPEIPTDMPELFEKIKNQGTKVVAFPLHESWHDIGNRQDLSRINSDRETKN